MLTMRHTLLVAGFLAVQLAYGQFETKTTTAVRCTVPPRIDGDLGDVAWLEAPVATGFIVDRPVPGKPAAFATEVRMLYDDEAVYIAFMNHDPEPDSILAQLSGRDNQGNTDYCGITFGCYRDGINGFTFAVSPVAEQYDARDGLNAGGGTTRDVSWNAVWHCHTKLLSDGWTAEYRIPFAALRFPESEIQDWDINFFREIRRIREHAYWSGVNPVQAGFLTQMGRVQGISQIKPPIRLFFFPYASSYVNFQGNGKGAPATRSTSYNGGMDVKLGLSDAFTLDATLIPDFGQTISDQLILNITPFEIQFADNRQFFTEGLDLFGKGGVFYSRRVGSVNHEAALPVETGEGESVSILPVETRLFNATKISGRTRSGLGLGFFNAVSAPAYAVVVNDETNTSRDVLYYPMTNHNVTVVDQNLRNNGYFSLLNSNVARDGEAYDANVTATQFELRDRKNNFALTGRGALSSKFNYSDQEADNGYTSEVGIGKISGNLTGSAGVLVESTHYDPNDLGFLMNANQVTYSANVGYSIYEPFGPFNRLWSSLAFNYDNLYSPYTFTSAAVSAEVGWVTRTFQAYGLNLDVTPVRGYDYFDPRVDGYVFRTPRNQTFGGWVSTDYRKRLALDASSYYGISSFPGAYNWNYRVSPRWRVNDHIMLIYVYSFQSNNKNIGFADIYRGPDDDELPVVGTRDVISHTNVLTVNYAINPLMLATCRVRHYWGFSRYFQFYGLDPWGELTATPYEGFRPEGGTLADDNFNSFTIDLQYRWIFTPGSELTMVWKNSITEFVNDIPSDLLENVDRLLGLPQVNSFSIRLLYFLDYNSLTRRHQPVTRIKEKRPSLSRQPLRTEGGTRTLTPFGTRT